MESYLPQRKTVLIVDDDDATAELLEEVLNAEPGYHAVSVRDSMHALDFIRSSSVDLVLLDVLMPGISGLQLRAILRENPATCGIPVVFVTAKTNYPELSGASDETVLEKPFELDVLLSVVASAIRQDTAGHALDRNGSTLNSPY